MSWHQLLDKFWEGLLATRWQEFLAVAFGIASVLYSRKENILVFPTGIVNTLLYTWFCFGWWGLYAEGSLNLYYTIMSIYGWLLWRRRGANGESTGIKMTKGNAKAWAAALAFFGVGFVILYSILVKFTTSTVPIADAFASAAAYTGMWLMAKKKLENWLWWMLTNLVSIPLYFVKGAVFTSAQYLVFFVLAVAGYAAWKKKLAAQNA
jgi:nicotinamide mononucleotide transporter